MRMLKISLWITAIGCLIAVPFIFVPWSVIADMGSCFGVEPLPDAPFVVYLFRVICGIFGLIGVFFVLLALDPLKYGPMLNLGAYGLILFGLLAMITGTSIGLTPVVYLGDGVSGLILGSAILLFAAKARQG